MLRPIPSGTGTTALTTATDGTASALPMLSPRLRPHLNTTGDTMEATGAMDGTASDLPMLSQRPHLNGMAGMEATGATDGTASALLMLNLRLRLPLNGMA